MIKFWDTLWHQKFGRPYRLACPINTGGGVPILMLHGVGRSSGVWNYLIGILAHKPYRVMAFDLLGFGLSPKPDWLQYTVDDHAQAVINTMKKEGVVHPAVLVGHSMGCLIAVRVAELRPDLVRHLVLYEMPLYAGLPEKRHYQVRLKLYSSVYNRIIKFQPDFSGSKRRPAERIAELLKLPRPSRETWKPFIRSLENTILAQNTTAAIKALKVPMDVIYGSRDMLVIRGEVKNIFGEDATNITAHTIRASHTISLEASKFIAERIDSAISGRSALTPHQPDRPNKPRKPRGKNA